MPGTTKPGKERADKLLVSLGLAESRERAQGLILSGSVLWNEEVISKAGQLVPQDATLEVRSAALPYVSRGGFKLEKALQVFHIDPTGMTCLDIGASTGGFTDCLLQNGAQAVCAVDVGYGQLAWSLRQDSRVTNLERTNFRYLDAGVWAGNIDLAVTDVSFISLRHIFERLPEYLTPSGLVIALIKPQFEAGRDKVGKNGVVRDPRVHAEVLRQVLVDGQRAGLSLLSLDWSPIKGPKGNIEFLSLWQQGFHESEKCKNESDIDFEQIVMAAHAALDSKS